MYSFKTIRRSGDKVYILSEISRLRRASPCSACRFDGIGRPASRRIPFPIATTQPTLWLCVRFFLTVR